MKVRIKKKNYNFITSWGQCTTRQYEQLIDNIGLKADAFKAIEMLSIISDMPKSIVGAMKNSHVEERLLPKLSFLETPPQFSEKAERELVIYGKKRKLPIDMGKLSFAQKLAADELINENPQIEKVIAQAVAIFIYPTITGNDYNDKEVDRFAKHVIGKMPILTIYPIACFFLRKYSDFVMNGQPKLSILNRAKNNLKRVSTSLRSLVRLGCFMVWPAAISLTLIKFCTYLFMM